MKIFKIVSSITLIASVVLYALGILLTGVITEVESEAFFILIEANILILAFAIVGVFLMFAKNDAARKLGNGLTVVGMFVGAVLSLGYIIALDEAAEEIAESAVETEINTPIGAILIIIAAIVLLLHYALILVDYLLNKTDGTNPSNDKKIARIREWKQLKDEGFITEEEYEEKRVMILGIEPKADESDTAK